MKQRGPSSSRNRKPYDVLIDLFGSFPPPLKRKCNKTDIRFQHTTFFNYRTGNWFELYNNHRELSGRTHFSLQKVLINNTPEFHALFEARRIGLFTLDEFKQGKSRIIPPCTNPPIKNDFKRV